MTPWISLGFFGLGVIGVALQCIAELVWRKREGRFEGAKLFYRS